MAASGRRSDPTDLPEWPLDKPLPNFRSEAAEVKFWHSWSFANVLDMYGYEVPRTKAVSYFNDGKKRVKIGPGWGLPAHIKKLEKLTFVVKSKGTQ